MLVDTVIVCLYYIYSIFIVCCNIGNIRVICEFSRKASFYILECIIFFVSLHVIIPMLYQTCNTN